MNTIGIIGGMGPEATLDLFRKITENTKADKDQDHLHIIIDSYPAIPDRTAFLMGKGISPLPYLTESAKRLENAGADMLCMPCNTAHYFADSIKNEINIPLVSIIEATKDAILNKDNKCENVGLLATRGTFLGRVYHNVLEQAGIKVIEVPENVQDDVMDVIYSVKAGKGQEKVTKLQKAVSELENLGADILIAGCTEIPLLFDKIESKAMKIDPTKELALKVISLASE